MQSSRFAAFRVRTAERHVWREPPSDEVWLLVEWPRGKASPTKYHLSSLPAETPLKELVRLSKLRWRIERDYQELKGEVGLDHFEGRSWRGFHHHATLCMVAHGFLALRRALFSPAEDTVDAARGAVETPAPVASPHRSLSAAPALARLREQRRACDRVVLGGEQHATAQQLEAGTAVHLALEELELRDLTFGLGVTPRSGQSGPDGITILLKALRKGFYCTHVTRASLAQPLLEGDAGHSRLGTARGAPLAHQFSEATGQINDTCSLLILCDASQRGQFDRSESGLRLDAEPSQLLG